MVTLNLNELSRNKQDDNENVDEILQSLRNQHITGLLSVELTNMRMRLTFDSLETPRNLARDGLSLTTSKKIRVFSEHKPEFVVTACGIPGYYENKDIQKIFTNFGEVERVKKVIRTTKSGIEYTNGNRVIIFTSFNQKPPKKIYIDSHRVTLVYSTIPAHYFSAEENREEQIVNETESISGESIHSLDLFTEKSDERSKNVEQEKEEVEQMDMEIIAIPETPIENLVKAANQIDSTELTSPAVVRKKARIKSPEPSPALIDSKIPRLVGHTHSSTRQRTRRSRNAENQAKEKVYPIQSTSDDIEEMESQTMSAKGEKWGDSQPIEPPTPTPERTDPFESRESLREYADRLFGEGKIQPNYPHGAIKLNKDGSINSLGRLSWLVQCTHSHPWLKFVATGLGAELHRTKLKKENITGLPNLIRDQLLGLIQLQGCYKESVAVGKVWGDVVRATSNKIKKIPKDIFDYSKELKEFLIINE